MLQCFMFSQVEVVDMGYRLREEGQMIVKSELPSLDMRRQSLTKLGEF